MGTLRDVDGTATGTVALFHKPDGSFAITFEESSVASNAHTNVTFVMNSEVTNYADIDKTEIVDLGPLKGTTGMIAPFGGPPETTSDPDRGARLVIVEGLDLSRVEPGEDDFVCLPLLIPGSDGGPARAMLRRVVR